MNLRYYLFIMNCILSFNITLVAQHQFQHYYGNGYSIGNQFDMEHSLGKTTIMFSLSDCFDIDMIPKCVNVGFITLNNSDTIESIYRLFSQGNDTSYTLYDFIKINGKIICAAGNAHSPSGLFNNHATVILIDSNFSPIKTTGFVFGGISYFTKVMSIGINGSYFLTGTIDSVFHPTSKATIIMSMDSSLTPLWSKVISSRFAPTILDFEFTLNGNIVACGYVTDSAPNVSHTLLMKMDMSGNIIWAKKYSTNIKPSYAQNIDVLNDGFVLFGTAWDTIYDDALSYLMKVDTSGNIVWLKKYVCDASHINSLLKTSDNDYLFSGQFNNGGVLVASLTKTDDQGNVAWNYYYTKGNWNLNHSEDSNGNYYSLGKSRFSSGIGFPDSVNLYLIKTDSLGSSGCFESTFPISISTDNNFTATSQPVTVSDYLPLSYSFGLQRDTFILNRSVICEGFTGINDFAESKKYFSIFPNPTKDKISIQFESLIKGNARVALWDLNNKLINAVNYNLNLGMNLFYFDLNEIDDGIYMITLDNGYTKFRSKIIKLKAY